MTGDEAGTAGVGIETIELSAASSGEPTSTARVRLLAGLISLLLLVNVVVLAVGPRQSSQAAPPKLVSVTSSAQQTLAAGTARVHTRLSVQGVGNGANVTTANAGDGVIDFARHRSSFASKAKNVGTITVRSIGSVIYMQYPEKVRSALQVPTPWVAVDVAIPGAAGPSQPAGGDLDSTLRQLQAGSLGTVTGFRTIGHEKVRGVATTRVEAQLDKAAMNALLQDLKGFGPVAGSEVRGVTQDLWVSADGLIRRINAHSVTAVLGRTVTLDQVTEYFDFGVRVEVTAPRDSEVTHYSSFQNLAAGIRR